MTTYQALELIEKDDKITPEIVTKPFKKLAPKMTRVKVHYSDINHKDQLALDPKSKVIRNYPIVGGIDFSGIVTESSDGLWQKNDQVIGTGYGIGVSQDGGYAQYIDVPSNWLIRLPQEMSLKKAMINGTAGVTAAIALSTILHYQDTSDKEIPILVTGGSGNVGQLAISMLAKLGYQNITVATRNLKNRTYLMKLGSKQVIDTNSLITERRPLGHQTYSHVVDCVGGEVLAAVLPIVAYGGNIAALANAGGNQLDTTVLPFILRGISLNGVDSVNYPNSNRKEIWELLASSFAFESNLLNINEITLEQLPSALKNTHSNERVLIKLI